MYDGVPLDRSSWLLRPNTVEDLFVQVGWGRFVENPDYNCVLDDGGIWLTPDVHVEIFNGFYGSLYVTQSSSEDGDAMSQQESRSSTTIYQSGDSNSCDGSWCCDESALLQFWAGLEVDWELPSSHDSPRAEGLKSPKLQNECFNADSFWQALENVPSRCSIGDIPAEARLLDQILIEDDGERISDEDDSTDEGDIPVSFSNWNDLAAHNDVAEDVPRDGIRLITFGLKNVACGRRDVITQSLRPTHLRRVIWNLWHDIAGRTDGLEVYFVLPQPWDELQAPGAIILLVEVYQEHLSQVPVLSLVWDETANVLMIDPHAMLMPRRANKPEVLERLPFGELCAPVGLRPCSLSCGLHRFSPEDEATQVAIGKGYLCKILMHGKREEFIQAETWIQNFERFAMTLLDELPDGKAQITVCIHHLNGTNSQVDLSCQDVYHPAAIVKSLHDVSGRTNATFKYVDSTDVYVAHVSCWYDRHLIEIDVSRDDMITVLVITYVRGVDKIRKVKGTQAHSWALNNAPWPEVLHMRLCADYEVGASSSFDFSVNGRSIDRFDMLGTGQSIVHVVSLPLPDHISDDDDVPSGGHTEVNMGLRSATQEDHVDSEEVEDVQLIQKKLEVLHQRSTKWILQHSLPMIVDRNPGHDTFQWRSHFVGRFPQRFVEPLAWSEIQLRFNPLAKAELLTPVVKNYNQVDIVVEFEQGVCPFVMRTSVDTTVRCIIQELGLTECAMLFQNGLPKFEDQRLHLQDADICSFPSTLFISSVETSNFVELEQSSLGQSDLNFIRTCWLCNFDQANMQQIDLTTANDPTKHQRKIDEVTDGTRSVSVPWLPPDIRQHEDIRLLCSDEDECTTVSILVLCDSCNSRTWKHACVKPNLDLQLVDSLMDDWQWAELNGLRILKSDFARNAVSSMVLRHGDVLICRQRRACTRKQYGKDTVNWPCGSIEEGEAPCPSDRWCADPDSLDFMADLQCLWIDQIPHKWPTPQRVGPSCRMTKREMAFQKVERKEDENNFETSISSPVVLALDHIVPKCVTNPDGLRLPCRNTWLSSIFQAWDHPLWPLPDGLKVHHATADALSKSEQPIRQFGVQTYAYIDGSASISGAAWAIAIVDTGQNQYGCNVDSLCGVLFGMLPRDSSSSRWWGTQYNDSIDAELSACIVAISWYLANGDHSKGLILCPDLMYTIQLVEGNCGPCSDRPISFLVAELGALASAKGLCTKHVPAHKAWAWNELVDGLANFAVTNQENDNIDLPVVQDMVANLNCIHLWTWCEEIRSDAMKTVLPSQADDQSYFAPMIESKADIRLDQIHCNLQAAMSEFQLKFFSYNILSIREKADGSESEVGRAYDVKTDRVDAQLHQLGFHVACLQEARTAQGCHSSTNYHIFSSGAEKCGNSLHYGCEIWIHKHLPWARDPQGNEVGPDIRKLQVLISEPRCIVVRADIGDHAWTIASIHAPCVGAKHSLEDVESWWANLTAKLTDKIQGTFFILGLDANAGLGSQTSTGVGGHDNVGEGKADHLFNGMIHDLALCAPCTYEHLHQGQCWTWKHPKGHVKRCDFILVDSELIHCCHKSFVITDFDGGHCHEDHLPVAVTMHGSLEVHQSPKFQLDEEAMLDPVKCEQFRAALETLPIPEWVTSIEEHAYLLRTQIKQLALQFFPPVKSKVRNRWMSETAKNLVQFKRQVLQAYRSCEEGLQRHEIQLELRQIEKMVVAQCRKDKQTFFESIAQNLARDGELGCFKSVFRSLARLGASKNKRKGIKCKPLPQLQKEDGSTASSFHERQQLFFTQFADIEGAETRDMASFVLDLHQKSAPLVRDLSACFVPAVSHIMQKIKRVKRGKAPGPDQIPSSLLKAGGSTLAQHLHVLFAKVAVFQHEPVEWKSGVLVPLFKKGASQDPKNYRSIFLSDYTAKLYHSCFRDHLAEALESKADQWQFGGRKARGTDMAHHIVQSFGAWCQCKSRSHGTFFLDLHSAFYQVLRQFLFRSDWTDRQICWLLHHVGVSPDVFHEFANKQIALESFSEHGASILQDIFDQAHFQMAGIPQVAIPSRGTRPGDPIGDVCFNLVMVDMIYRVRDKLQSQGLQWLGSQTGAPWQMSPPDLRGIGFLDVAFVDDICMLMVGDGHLLKKAASHVAGVWCEEAGSRGLCVNFKQDKTELMINFRGVGSRQLRRQTWVDSQDRLQVLTENSSVQLRMVRGYKHLGTHIQEDCRPNKAVVCKRASAKQAWGPLVRPFFQRRDVLLKTKVDIFRSLVLSRYTFQVHTWSWVKASTITAWNNGIRHMLFGLARHSFPGVNIATLDVDTICGMVQIPTPRDCMAKQRLLYIARMLTWGPAVLWAFVLDVTVPDGWCGHVVGDLEWLTRFCTVKLPNISTTDVRGWLQHIANDPKWPMYVKNAAKACVRYRQRQADVKLWELRVATTLHNNGVVCKQILPKQACLQCTICGESFGSRRALGMHSHLVHGYLPEVKFFADGSTCFACGKEFHDRHVSFVISKEMSCAFRRTKVVSLLCPMRR